MLISSSTFGQEPTPDGIAYFEKKVRPLLVERCLDCHTGDETESGLAMDSLAGLLKGGLRGPAIVIGEPEESLLIRALRHGEILKMPPKEKLSASLIADLAAWIKMGAPWPNAEPVAIPQNEPGSDEVTFTQEQRSFWSFQPPRKPTMPAVKDQTWVRSAIDAFILRDLEAAGFQPASPATKRVLIRRATFDLLGLPPTPEEVDAFAADESPHAFAKLIDRLLNSPRYGERWGRHWLDVARYADSNGLDENLAFADAFHYRDYVIAAFNKDKPFDWFVQEQIAGDLLETAEVKQPHDWHAPYEGTVATGFLALGAKMLAEDDPVKMQMDIIDEQVDTLGRAFMGLTFGCARCHDHKFDPIPTADYYSLAGIFKSTKTMENFNVVARWQEKPLASAEATAALDEHKKKIEAKQAAIDKLVTQSSETVLAEARQHVGDYLLAAAELERLNNLIADATIHGENPDLATVPNALLIEADEFDRGNVLRDRTNWGKGIGVLVNAGETPNFAEYDIEVKEAGLYQLEIRVAAAAARPTMLFINGQLAKKDAAGEVTGSWYPDGQKWFVEGFYRLNAGKNVIRLEQPQFFPHIDKILFILASRFGGDPDEHAPLGDYEPKPEFVQQWSDYLKKTKDDPASPFAKWQAAVAQQEPVRELAAQYNEQAVGHIESDEPLATVLRDPEGPFKVSDKIEVYYAPQAQEQLASVRADKKLLDDTMPKFPEAMAVSDGAVEDIRIHIRGSHLTQGRQVPRRVPRIFTRHESTPFGDDVSGRLELARWMTSANHPLTARVMVNRIWQWHFGEGLVRSPDNFGKLGLRPTHPELLDWLAVTFVESGWSIKQLHRTIMLSSTYQMSTAFNEQAASVDPENKLWWRFNRRRVEAESIRDSILAAAGQLDLNMGGSMLPTANRAYVTSTANVDPVAYQTNRRSIYLPVVRSALYEVFQAFDFAEPSVSAGQRQSTTVAPQALFMMNSKIVADATRAMAERLLANESADDAARVTAAYRTAYGRSPNEIELQRAMKFVEAYTESLIAAGSASEEVRVKAWQSLCRVILSANEFIYVE
ncbi:MAG: DUF1553 domain-containing protein [Planctomycetota bacterium]|nr:DUF1553 domain-containing protein [Planctomycetota bacterium]